MFKSTSQVSVKRFWGIGSLLVFIFLSVYCTIMSPTHTAPAEAWYVTTIVALFYFGKECFAGLYEKLKK